MTKDGTPQSKSYLIMKKMMIYCLLTSLTHAKSIYHNNMSLSEIIYGQNFAQSHQLCKKGHPRRSLCTPHILLWEAPTFSTSQGVKEGLDLERASFGGNPYHNLSSHLLHTLAECNPWRKEAKTSNSQSCASLEKLTFQ
jgi:hypothetical protein